MTVKQWPLLRLCLVYGKFTYLDVNTSQWLLTNHAKLTHLLKQTSDKLTDTQAHWVERLMSFAHCMNIIYRKGSINEADDVSRRFDFFHPDTDVYLRMRVEMFAL